MRRGLGSTLGRGRVSCAPKLKLPGGPASMPKRTFIAMPRGEEAVIVGGLIGTNVGVYGLWHYGPFDYYFMRDHFTVCRAGISERPHTLLTAAFSHNDGTHLLMNMVTLFFFGPSVISAVGASAFLSLYVSSGVVANAAHCMAAKHRRQPALGASGAINAVVTYSVLADPFRMIVVFMEFFPVPLPALAYGGLYVGKDVAALLDVDLPIPGFGGGSGPAGAEVAHAAHLGGAAFGAAYYFLSRGRGGGAGPWRRLR